MKHSMYIKLFVLSLLYLTLLSCEDEETVIPISYPQETDYGINILNENIDTVYFDEPYAFAAKLETNDSLKIVVREGSWFYNSAPNGPIGWKMNFYSDSNQAQTFWSKPGVDFCNLTIFFVTKANPTAKEQTVYIDYYENSDSIPTFTKVLQVVKHSYSHLVFAPEEGNNGYNLLFPDVDELKASIDSSYSIDVIIQKDHMMTGVIELYSTYYHKVADVVEINTTEIQDFAVEYVGNDLRFEFVSQKQQHLSFPIKFKQAGSLRAWCRVVDSTQFDVSTPVFYRTFALEVQ